MAEGVMGICPDVFANTHHRYSPTANALGSACPRRGDSGFVGSHLSTV